MNTSESERRVLCALAQDSAIRVRRAANDEVCGVSFVSRDGHVLADCTSPVFNGLRRRRLFRSANGRPHRVAPLAIVPALSRPDNRKEPNP